METWVSMRKGQFVFNFLRDYFGKGTFENPYPNCHSVIFNVSDENWDIIEQEYTKFKSNPREYQFPKKPFGESIISKAHEEAMKSMFTKNLKIGSSTSTNTSGGFTFNI